MVNIIHDILGKHLGIAPQPLSMPLVWQLSWNIPKVGTGPQRLSWLAYKIL